MTDDRTSEPGSAEVAKRMTVLRRHLHDAVPLDKTATFAHHYRPLQDQELTFVLTQRWRDLGLAMDDADFTDVQAVVTVVRITGGNFRLLHRLFAPIERILRINGLNAITVDVVEAAHSTLVIGVT